MTSYSTNLANNVFITQIVSFRCSRLLWLTLASSVSLVAIFSAPVMALLPHLLPLFGHPWIISQCEVVLVLSLLIVLVIFGL